MVEVTKGIVVYRATDSPPKGFMFGNLWTPKTSLHLLRCPLQRFDAYAKSKVWYDFLFILQCVPHNTVEVTKGIVVYRATDSLLKDFMFGNFWSA
jgi:hypothetical protein